MNTLINILIILALISGMVSCISMQRSDHATADLRSQLELSEQRRVEAEQWAFKLAERVKALEEVE